MCGTFEVVWGLAGCVFVGSGPVHSVQLGHGSSVLVELENRALREVVTVASVVGMEGFGVVVVLLVASAEVTAAPPVAPEVEAWLFAVLTLALALAAGLLDDGEDDEEPSQVTTLGPGAVYALPPLSGLPVLP